MTKEIKILMTGVTGYIGGTVLGRFMQRPDYASMDIRAIVRSAEKAEKFKSQFGITPIVGSHSDIPLMEKAASEVDVVIAMADCDDVDAAEGTLKGLKKRFEATGKQPIFINTSGTGVLADNAAGQYAAETIWDDANPDQMETLKPTQPHRPVDLKIVAADAAGYVKTYILLPPTIWAIAKGPLFEAGLSNPHSIQIPALIRASLDRKQGGMVGEGKNIWHNVEVHELSELYSILFDAAQAGSARHGREGYYFGANEDHTLYDVGKAIGGALLRIGKASSTEPTTFTKEEIDKYFAGSNYLGSNSRCKSTQSWALGWKPKKTTKDMLESIYSELEAVIKLNLPAESKKL